VVIFSLTISLEGRCPRTQEAALYLEDCLKGNLKPQDVANFKEEPSAQGAAALGGVIHPSLNHAIAPHLDMLVSASKKLKVPIDIHQAEDVYWARVTDAFTHEPASSPMVTQYTDMIEGKPSAKISYGGVLNDIRDCRKTSSQKGNNNHLVDSAKVTSGGLSLHPDEWEDNNTTSITTMGLHKIPEGLLATPGTSLHQTRVVTNGGLKTTRLDDDDLNNHPLMELHKRSSYCVGYYP
jgi:hypothetical protein